MAIVQEAFEISEDMMALILTGELKRFGGVVRNNKGHIVKHLKRINLSESNDKLKKVGIRVAEFANNNKYSLIPVFVGIVATASAYSVVQGKKK